MSWLTVYQIIWKSKEPILTVVADKKEGKR